MPISTSSPLREILWNKLYAPQYQTVDQNNISVAADRNRRVTTTDAIMQGDQINTEGMIESNRQEQLKLEQALKADPGNQELAAQLTQLRAAQPGLEQQLQNTIANQGKSYDEQLVSGAATRSAFNVGNDAGKIMLGLPNLTKKQDFKTNVTRTGGNTLDKLFKDAESKPEPDAMDLNNSNSATPSPNDKDKLTKYKDYKNFLGGKK